jgi:O-antigen/teichoic acid export membrane protein
MSIKKKLIKGAVWNAISQFGSQGINLLIIVALARLLEPRDFGLVGMVSVITSFLGYFTEFGLLASIIRKRDIDDGDIYTVYWSTIAFSCLVYVVVFFASPLVSLFYQDNRLTLITRVLFLNFLAATLAFIPEALQAKSLEYSKITAANLIGGALSGGLGIALALMKCGVWSLVFQQISMTLFRGVVLVVSTGWRPKFFFSYGKFKELFSFGGHYTLRNLMLYLSENFDYLLVGKLLGPSALGIYTLAFRMSKYAFLKLWGIFGKMLFPAFSSFSGDMERVRKNYIRVSVAGGIVLVPVFIGLLFGLEALVPLIFGAKWLPSVPVVKIFISYLVIASFSYADDPLMISLNEIKILNAAKAMAALMLAGLGYWWAAKYGLVGMAWAFSLSSLAYLIFVKAMVLKRIAISFRAYSAYILPVSIMMMSLLVSGGTYKAILTGLPVRPLLFLAGEAAVIGAVSCAVLIACGIVDRRSKKINIDAVLEFN